MFTTGKKDAVAELKEESETFMIQQGLMNMGFNDVQLRRIQALLMKKMVDGPDKINDPVEALKLSIQEFEQEQNKLEKDRATLNERLQALNLEREKALQQLTMIAGALQTINHFIEQIEPTSNTEDEV